MDVISRRRFDIGDQEFFARISGDWNPLHLDPLAARRTQAGAPVVHGMHALLWSLEVLAAHLPGPLYLESLRAKLHNFLYLADEALCILQAQEPGKLKWQVVVAGLAVLKASAMVTSMPVQTSPGPDGEILERPLMESPDEITFDRAARMQGDVSFAAKMETLAAAFPKAAGMIGPHGVAVIACSSKLVGMVCPGLHSVFGSINLRFQGCENHAGRLHYEIAEADERFRLLQIAISSGGASGSIEAFMRAAPVRQPSFAEIALQVHPGEFAGETALIIGASRGLGELTAKAIACGGGRVVASYASGREEADALARQIRDFGGECQILRYDVLLPPVDQLKELRWPPTRLFYFATPKIFRQKHAVLDRALLNDFLDFYVYGFYELCEFLLTQTSTPISVYYPSSVALDSRPDNLTEYAMAKAAGEIVCDDLRRSSRRLDILHTRLPRLATDQTNSIGGEPAPPALREMLAVIRRMSAGGTL
jgi:hypothetical protein